MMKRSIDRILTTHTGSLPRPTALTELLGRIDRGELPADTEPFPTAVRAAVVDAIEKQVEVGLDVINDGEVSKVGYSTYVKDRLTGFGGDHVGIESLPPDFQEFPVYMQRLMDIPFVMPACIAPVAYRGTAGVRRDISNLLEAAPLAVNRELFMSSASPGVISVFLPNRYYPSHEAYLEALGEAMKVEYDEIHAAGLTLQLDCPDLAMGRHMFGDPSVDEFLVRIARHVEILNQATRDIPSESMRLHLCWGNYEGPHNHDVPLREVIDVVLRARPAAISFEAANPRHAHEWKVFEDVKLPDGKVLIPGVIDSTTNYIEHPSLVAERIVRYAQLVGRENVMAGTDCGFATFAGLMPVDPAIAWAKLHSMVEGAALASRELW